jgi:regulatory protein
LKVERPRRSKPESAKPKSDPTARALRLLARREHTRAELARKLAHDVEDPLALEALLDDLAARGWLSDSRFAEQFAHARRGRFGIAALRRALLDRGVPEDIVGRALEPLKEGQLEAARAIWARKFKTVPGTAAERARQVRFLQARGFATELALRVVRGGTE